MRMRRNFLSEIFRVSELFSEVEIVLKASTQWKQEVKIEESDFPNCHDVAGLNCSDDDG